MMITINTNTTAMVAQQNLNNTQSGLSASMLKLSTGLRINSASDDAAGLQISNRMETQINGLNVAQRNANDGISMAQTAEGAMVEVTDMLNRMRDLSLQAANSSNTDKDRGAMQKEMNALASEITRVAEKTEFAGIKLLNGEGASKTTKEFSFQVGANADETIKFSLNNIDAEALGVSGQGSTFAAKQTIAAKATSGTYDAAPATSLVKATVDGKEVKIDLAGKNLVEAKEALSKGLGVDSKAINIDTANGAITIDAGTKTSGKVTALYIGNAANSLTPGSTGDANKGLDISNKTNADAAVKALDKALTSIDDQRALLGAVQNRLESTIDNLSNITTNMTASQSRIKNVDFAKETTNMTSKQMMMQAGSTVLAQAKGLPQFAAQLLR